MNPSIVEYVESCSVGLRLPLQLFPRPTDWGVTAMVHACITRKPC